MWKYLIRESPEIQSRSVLHLSISSSVPCALSLLCALKTSLKKCFFPLSYQGSCTLPKGAVFMVLSTFQNEVSRFFNTRNHFAFLGCTDREGAHAARRGGDGDAAKGPVSAWEWAPPSIPTCSHTWALSWEFLHIRHGMRHLPLGSEKVQC